MDGRAPIRVRDPVFGERVQFIENSLNEPVMRDIASITGGRFYRARSRSALSEIYSEISQMEQTEIQTTQIPRYSALTFKIFLISAGVLLLVIQFILGTDGLPHASVAHQALLWLTV